MLRFRAYGDTGPEVFVLHGGPAAVGEAAPLARGLAEGLRVIEPWQRGSGPEPLSVARHVRDLRELLVARGEPARPGLVGESWGAMLALAFAAAHPHRVGAIALVGCGTFDSQARVRLRATVRERMGADLQRRLDELPRRYPDPDQRLAAEYELIRPLYMFDPLPEEPCDLPSEPLDVRAHTETWEDMLRLQREGVYPAAFAAIRCPVLMLHGAYDPHPGAMIRATLARYLPQLEYHEWARCGHSPWRERGVRGEFFALLREWLRRHL